MVAIKNNSNRDFIDMFDGKSYNIPAGKSEKVPDGAAKLWFGVGGTADDKRESLRRRSKLSDASWLDRFEVMKIVENYVSIAEASSSERNQNIETRNAAKPK